MTIRNTLTVLLLCSVAATTAAIAADSATTPANAATAKEGRAKPRPFSGADLSGVYACTGEDAHDGPFKATVTLKLDRENSTRRYAGYAYRMDVEGFGTYLGSAAASGNQLAITFANENPAKKDYGTGIAAVDHTAAHVRLKKFYYQPEYESGNHGFETCVRQKPTRK